MGNLKAKDADSVTKYLKASGIGTDEDPYIVEHSNSAAISKLQDSITQLAAIAQQLTDLALMKAQLQTLIDSSGTIKNFPTTQTINGTVSVGNFPSSQAVSVSNFPATQPISGSVGITNFPATQPISGAVSVSNFPATQPISGAISVSNFPASQAVAVSNFPAAQPIMDNQTTYLEASINYAANGVFNGTSRDALNRNTVRGWVWVNVNGTLYVDQSRDSTNWRQTDTIPITGSTAQATDFSFKLAVRYYRLRYVNGMMAQTTFELISTAFGLGL